MVPSTQRLPDVDATLDHSQRMIRFSTVEDVVGPFLIVGHEDLVEINQ